MKMDLHNIIRATITEEKESNDPWFVICKALSNCYRMRMQPQKNRMDRRTLSLQHQFAPAPGVSDRCYLHNSGYLLQ